MKKLLVGAVAASAVLSVGSVWAADMPMRTKAPAPVAAGYDWSGIYIGVHGGGVWQEQRFDDPVGYTVLNQMFAPGFGFNSGPAREKVKGTSWLGGGQIGANYQIGRFVLGTEFDVSATRLKNNSSVGVLPLQITPFPGTAGTETFASTTDWIATATTRLGVARDTFLIYGKAGGAWARTNNSAALTASVVRFPPAATLAGSVSDTRIGWTVGVGAEWAFAQNWTAKIEYDYIDFGTTVQNMAATGNTGGIAAGGPFPLVANLPVSVHQDLSMVKAGINYKFNGFLF